VVAPVYNEQDGIAAFCERALAAVETVVADVELLLVDDGSTDGSRAVLDELVAADPRIRVLSLSRNFGHQPAVTAGLDHATGDCVVVIDSDLQDPPEVMVRLLEAWATGAEVVHAVRTQRKGEKRRRNAAIWVYYRMLSRLTPVAVTLDAGDFRLYDRTAVDALKSMPERRRFTRGLASWVGYRQTSVSYVREERFAGHSKYPTRQLVRLALNGIMSFSYVPLQLASVLGFVISLVTALLIPVVIVLRLLGSSGLVGGNATLLLAVMMLGGVQLLFLGVIGEYLGVVTDEVKRRPVYLVAHDSADSTHAAERSPS
jgi:dolichol-phosphate mannosyltransferase